MRDEYDFSDGKKNPYAERKHTPQIGMDGVTCSVCGKRLDSQEQDKPCPGPLTQAGLTKDE